jgi:hypothetical protein
MSPNAFPEEITTLLTEHRFGALATYGGEYPYTSLISLAFSNDFRFIIFPTLRETRKYANLCHETRVSVLLDNRSFEKSPEKLYALTILGSASETDQAMFAGCKGLFLQRHPQLAEFLALPETALIQIALKKIILVEELQKIREFDCSPVE